MEISHLGRMPWLRKGSQGAKDLRKSTQVESTARQQRQIAIRELAAIPEAPIASLQSRLFRNSYSGNRNERRILPNYPEVHFFLIKRQLRGACNERSEVDTTTALVAGTRIRRERWA